MADTETLTVERVGDGILVSLSNGAAIHFTDMDVARQMATNILMVCAFGADQLDEITAAAVDEIVHACPPDGGGGLMPCCGRTPFEVPRTDRMTVQGELVTCKGVTE